MSTLNLVLHPGHIYCRECLMQVPATFLVCPACHGFVREGNELVAPPLSSATISELEEQQGLLFPLLPEYPA